MKVTLDLDQLLQQGDISQDQYQKLNRLSQKGTKSHTFSIFLILAIISVMIGTVGLFPEFFKTIGNTLLNLFGAKGLHLLVILLSGAAAFLVGSGFLATLCAFSILTFLGHSGFFYTHASYFVFIEEPAKTVIFFSPGSYKCWMICTMM